MKNYLITSFHAVHETSYTEGELGFVNSYVEKAQITTENAKDALIEYIKKQLYLNIPFESIEVCEYCGINTSVLVDFENIQANEEEIKQWKEGKEKLYDNSINFKIQELIVINKL
jgi:hypothetical protein